MLRRDWLLVAIADRMAPIQVQKTMFKFAQEAGAPQVEIYDFEPYNWGPCSFAIYDDLGEMRDEDLIRFEPSGRGWNTYRTTAAGNERIEVLRSVADPHLLAELDKAREYVVRRPFARLLHDVYADYPEYATQSLFKE
jgi:uncharacterized protein